jgi:hypothetical protein
VTGFVPVPQVVKCVIEWAQNSVPIVNVFHVDVGHSPTIADCVLANSGVLLWWETIFSPLVHGSMVFQSVTSTDISVINGVQDIVTTTSVPNGTKAGDPESGQTAMVNSLRTNFTGRSFRGRSYAGGLVQGYLVSAQAFDPAASAVFNDAMIDLINIFNTISMTMGVVSTIALGVVRTVGIITEIIAVLTDTKIDTQRRRSAN